LRPGSGSVGGDPHRVRGRRRGDALLVQFGGRRLNNDGDTAFLLDPHRNVVHGLAQAASVTSNARPSTTTTKPKPSATGGGGGGNCDPSYPTVCIPPYPPDLGCGEIPHRRFQVLPPDPHGFDRDNDGIGCES